MSKPSKRTPRGRRPAERQSSAAGSGPQPSGHDERWLRIIGGTHRGRKLQAGGDARTRPMKDRVREAVFNLVSTGVRQKHAVDLFAGSGALGLEALSRGAAFATFFERHFPTAELIRRNAAELGVSGQVEVVPADTFIHFRRGTPVHEAPGAEAAPVGALSADRGWVVFFSPPWELFQSRHEDMLTLLGAIQVAAPTGSILVLEADQAFDFACLADAANWDVRSYPPAVVGIRHVG